MHRAFRHYRSIVALFALALSLAASAVAAPHYINTALVKNTGTGKHIDPQMINPWGLAYGPGNPFWLSDAGSGLSTLYDGTGVKQSLVVNIPTASGAGQSEDDRCRSKWEASMIKRGARTP